jgi:hypothetical protein
LSGIFCSVIAAIDENGQANGKLTLNTQSYDYADLSNTAYSSEQSAGISTSVGLVGPDQQASQAQQNNPDEKGNALRLNSLNVNLSNSRSYDKSLTLATLGEGNVTIRDDLETGEDSTQGLNRDLDNSEKTLVSYDNSMSVEATIDTRLFSEKGWDEIKGDVETIQAQATHFLDTVADTLDPYEDTSPSGEEFYDALRTYGLNREQAKALLADQSFRESVLTNLDIMSQALDQQPEKMVQASKVVEEAFYTETGETVIPISGGAPLTAEQKVVRGLAEVNHYLEENQDKAQYVEIALYAVQGPKGAIAYAVDQAIANSEVGAKIDEYATEAGETVAEWAEDMDLLPNEYEGDHYLVGGGKLAVGILLGSISGSKKGSDKVGGNQPSGPEGNVTTTFPPRTDHSAVNHGPLGNPNDSTSFASTFRSGNYTDHTLSEDTVLYRVIPDDGNPSGAYWTSTPPQGPLQSVIDSALDQNWGNTATRVVKAKVPADTRIFEGVAAPQRGLVGGGNQIVFDRNANPFNPEWIITND